MFFVREKLQCRFQISACKKQAVGTCSVGQGFEHNGLFVYMTCKTVFYAVHNNILVHISADVMHNSSRSIFSETPALKACGSFVITGMCQLQELKKVNKMWAVAKCIFSYHFSQLSCEVGKKSWMASDTQAVFVWPVQALKQVESLISCTPVKRNTGVTRRPQEGDFSLSCRDVCTMAVWLHGFFYSNASMHILQVQTIHTVSSYTWVNVSIQ